VTELGQSQPLSIRICLGHWRPRHQVLLAVTNTPSERLFTTIRARQHQGTRQQLERTEHHEKFVRAVAKFVTSRCVYDMYAQPALGFSLELLKHSSHLSLLAQGKTFLGRNRTEAKGRKCHPDGEVASFHGSYCLKMSDHMDRRWSVQT